MNIKYKQTPNYAKGPTQKIAVVWHGTLGSYNGAVDWLCKTASQRGDGTVSSAHYVIGRNEGEIIQLVKNEDIAWHAGNVSNPSERFKKIAPISGNKYLNPNQWTIGIEFAWGYDMNGDKKVTADERRINEWQFKAVKELMGTFGFPITKENVLTHRDIASYKSDNLLEDINEYFKRQEIVVELKDNTKEAIALEKNLNLCNDELKQTKSLLAQIMQLFFSKKV